MVRNVRNFWCDADVSGQQGRAFGPIGADGEMFLDIYQRANGEKTTAYRISCFAYAGDLNIRITDGDGNLVSQTTTRR